LITGPNILQDDYDRLNSLLQMSTCIACRADFPIHNSAGTLSVSQAGYNTIGDVLNAGCRFHINGSLRSGGGVEQEAPG
jgi:predicted glycosyltransferase